MADRITERFEERLAAFHQDIRGRGGVPGAQTDATAEGLQSLAAQGAHPLWLAKQTLGGCLNALTALEGAVPAAKMPDDAIPLINACGTVLALARSEIDTILKAEALVYAADMPDGGPDGS